jgi:hypothetical protein
VKLGKPMLASKVMHALHRYRETARTLDLHTGDGDVRHWKEWRPIPGPWVNGTGGLAQQPVVSPRSGMARA